MYRDLPRPFPGPYQPEGLSHNPAQTIPGPYPGNTPIGIWIGEPQRLNFVAGTGAATFQAYTSSWSSPLFDLRPELRANDGRNPNAIPIWRQGYGAAGRLWVMLTGLNTATSNTYAPSISLRVLGQEYAHINDSQQVQTVTPLYEVERDVASGGQRQAAVLQFFPTGDGYPIRFWRLALTFNKMQTTNITSTPPLYVSAAYY